MRGLARQRLGDLDDLPARQRQVLDRRQRMDVLAAGARQRLLGDAALRPAVDQAEALRRIADDDIVGDRQVGNQRQLLEDADNAGGHGRCRVGRRRPRAPSSIIRPSSGATTPAMILISVDLPAPFSPSTAWTRPASTVKRGLLQRPHAAIALGHAFHAEDRTAASILPLRRRRRGTSPRRQVPSCRSSLVGFGLPHDFLRGEVDAAGREGVADEEVVRLVGVVVRPRP